MGGAAAKGGQAGSVCTVGRSIVSMCGPGQTWPAIPDETSQTRPTGRSTGRAWVTWQPARQPEKMDEENETKHNSAEDSLQYGPFMFKRGSVSVSVV